MMNGVTILNEKVVYAHSPCLAWLIIIVFIVGFISCYILEEIHITTAIEILLTVVLYSSVIAIFFLVLAFFIPSSDYVKYQVTIDDNVKLNEFMNKYQIIEQEGKLYTIRENK